MAALKKKKQPTIILGQSRKKGGNAGKSPTGSNIPTLLAGTKETITMENRRFSKLGTQHLQEKNLSLKGHRVGLRSSEVDWLKAHALILRQLKKKPDGQKGKKKGGARWMGEKVGRRDLMVSSRRQSS